MGTGVRFHFWALRPSVGRRQRAVGRFGPAAGRGRSMGCKNVKEAKRAARTAPGSPHGEASVPVDRRRLSLGEVGDIDPGEDAAGDGSVEDEDRSTLLRMNQQQVLDLMQGGASGSGGGRRVSVGTATDAEMSKVPSFCGKTIKLAGDKMDAAQDCIGYACKKGKKPESPNQDSFFILKSEGKCCIYGVFDGHGHKGHDISNFIKDNLPKVLLQQKVLEEDPLTALSIAFEKTQQLIVEATRLKVLNATQSGSTASVIYHDLKENVLHVAHVGDSRCVMGRRKENPVAKVQAQDAEWHAVDLTIDHKPDLPEERQRIEAAGGRVVYDGGWNHRVYAKNHRGPGLNMSRAMGDLVGFYHAGISAIPDVQSITVQQDALNQSDDSTQDQIDQTGTPSHISSSASLSSFRLSPVDKFVLLCSDGVWEFISSEEAVRVVSAHSPQNAMEAAESLTALAWDRWIQELAGQVVDDITAIVVNLNYEDSSSPKAAAQEEAKKAVKESVPETAA